MFETYQPPMGCSQGSHTADAKLTSPHRSPPMLPLEEAIPWEMAAVVGLLLPKSNPSHNFCPNRPAWPSVYPDLHGHLSSKWRSPELPLGRSFSSLTLMYYLPLLVDLWPMAMAFGNWRDSILADVEMSQHGLLGPHADLASTGSSRCMASRLLVWLLYCGCAIALCLTHAP
jgi:hypothetical protein